MSMSKFLHARMVLAMALVKNVVLQPVKVGRRGAKPWLERLRKEDLGPVPQGAWGHFQGASRCIGCGLCDAVGAASESTSAATMGAARQPSDSPIELDRAATLLAAAEEVSRICPTRVSVQDIAALIAKNAQALGVSGRAR